MGFGGGVSAISVSGALNGLWPERREEIMKREVEKCLSFSQSAVFKV